jgi:uncharacterized protein
MSDAVTHFEIYAKEPNTLAEFYRELFGWKIEKLAGIDYFRIQTGATDNRGIGGGLLQRSIEGPRSWVHYVSVASIDQTIERLQKMGGKVVREKTAVPKTAWCAVVEDPQGNIFAVYQTDPAAFPPPEPD